MTGSRDDEQDRERTVVASPSFDALLEAQEGERSTAVDARSYDDLDGDEGDDWAQAPTVAAPSYDAQRAASGMTSLHEDEPTEQEPHPVAGVSADENPWETPPANPALPKTMILGPDAWGGAPPAPVASAVPYTPPPLAPVPMAAAPAPVPARSRSGVMLFALTALGTFVVGSCVVAGVLLMLLRS